MSYGTWEVVNNVAIVLCLVVPIVLAVLVFLKQRERRDAVGKRVGRPVMSSFITAFSSFLALVIAWGLTLQEAFPDYSARWRNENERQPDEHPSADVGIVRTGEVDVIDGIVGSWRPNNTRRSDYFTFTERTYASVNPEFDTIVTYRYRVLRRDGPCMRIQPTGSEVAQGGSVTQRSSLTQQPFFVCIDPETDQMLIRFDSDRGDVYFTRMN